MKTRTCRTKGHLLQGLLPILLCILAAGGLLLGAHPASAQTQTNGCIQNVWAAHGNQQNLQCTANDVRIAEVTNIDITDGGSCTGSGANKTCTCTTVSPPPTTCATNPSQPGCVTFTADYRVELTAQTRYDIGLYLGVDGDPNHDGALTGTCFESIITPTNAPSTFVNLDNPNNTQPPPADQCGDIDAAAAHNPQIVQLTVSTACVGDPVTGLLKLPNCTSWRQPGSNEVCTGPNDAFPGSPSKCNCQPGFTVNIRVATPTISVTKTADPTSLDEPGGNVTYSVDVKNNGTITVVITSLIDNLYGDLHGLGTCSVPQTIAAGATYSCSFTGAVSGNAGDVITDEVCASGHDNQTPQGTVGPTCDTADVTIGNVPASATLKKTVDSAVVTYRVVVTNTSGADALTLTRLCDDKFGDISGNGGSSPVCPAGSLGSASDSTCPNLSVSIAAGAKVECTFKGTITPLATGTTTVTDTVGGTLNDNDGNTLTPSDTATVVITQ